MVKRAPNQDPAGVCMRNEFCEFCEAEVPDGWHSELWRHGGISHRTHPPLSSLAAPDTTGQLDTTIAMGLEMSESQGIGPVL